MIRRLKPGEIIPDFQIDLPLKCVKLSELMDGKSIFLIFHRFYGCILTQYQLGVIDSDYNKLKSDEFRVAVVLQTSQGEMKDKTSVRNFSFPIICDIDKHLYNYFGVTPALSKEALSAPDTDDVLNIARGLGYIHGADSGDPLQLPAVILLNENRVIKFVHYSKNVGDLPSVSDLKRYLYGL